MNIALLISHYNTSDYSYSISKYVKEQCNKHGIGLFIYEGRRFLSDNLMERQHNVVYELISNNIIDGVISITPTIANEVNLSNYIAFLKKLDIPVVSIGIDIPGFPSITNNNDVGMVDLMNHLIKSHSDRQDFAFICGPKHNSEANLRLKIFKDMLNQNNISFSPSNIYAGDFTVISGYKAAIKMIKKIRDKKIKTIVAANDEMMVGAIKCFYEHGIHVPNDVSITGFDDFKFANMMKATTVRQPLDQMGQKAVDILRDIHNNQELEQRIYSFDSYCVPRESCSCTCDVHCSNINVDANFFEDYIEQIQTFDINILFNKLNKILKDNFISDFFIVKYKEKFNTLETSFRKVPKKSELIFGVCNSKQINYEHEFNTNEILPIEILSKIKHKNLIIKPLFFEHEHFGYFVSHSKDYDIRLIESLSPAISNAIMGSGLLKKQQNLIDNLATEYDKLVYTESKLNDTIRELNQLNSQLHGVAELDELTQTLNRYGFITRINDILKTNEDEQFCFIYCDMDGLKTINDTYGHKEGDLAINEMAKILQDSVRIDLDYRQSDLVARMGGDEFVVILRNVNSEDMIKFIEERIQTNLRSCNEKLERLNKPWKLSFSYGYLLSRDFANFEDLQNQADKLMYENKRKKKAHRN